ncbi:MAG TPA: shikimate kinase [Gemmatimonadaceae bacterium]|nr:shikimate kinase [Gemmatimonadaceae bacterium]
MATRESEGSGGHRARTAAPDTPNLILVGLPGAGKSAAGAMLAKRLARPFVDFDVEIERRAGATVAEIFRSRGEREFRRMELDLTRDLASRQGMVLAPGGGWIVTPGAVALLRPPGRIIYLRVSPDVALLRMGSAHHVRPLLRAPDPLAELRRLLAEREPAYLRADHVLDVDVLDLQGVTLALSRLAEG